MRVCDVEIGQKYAVCMPGKSKCVPMVVRESILEQRRYGAKRHRVFIMEDMSGERHKCSLNSIQRVWVPQHLWDKAEILKSRNKGAYVNGKGQICIPLVEEMQCTC